MLNCITASLNKARDTGIFRGCASLNKARDTGIFCGCAGLNKAHRELYGRCNIFILPKHSHRVIIKHISYKKETCI